MTMHRTDSTHLPLADWQDRIPDAAGRRFAIALQRGELQVELYRPERVDLQQPHDRDECYVVVDGQGIFEMDGRSVRFATGDFLFVPAGMPHRFAEFGEAMTAWVIFFGAVGGWKRDAS